MPQQILKELRIVKLYWKNYVFQSLMATAALFAVLIFIENEEVIIASLGATAFVVFAMPNNITAQPRRVIGGHIVGLLCGFTGSFILHLLPHPEHHLSQTAFYALTVGVSIFIMVVTDTEHPPAAGTALGVVLAGISFHIAAYVLFFSFLFTGIRLALKKHLRDLT